MARIVEKSGQTPLEFLLAQMRNPKNALAVRLEAAKAAAPFVHARLATTQIVMPQPEEPIEMTLIADGHVRKFIDGEEVGIERDNGGNSNLK